MKSIAALITVHNRKDKTLACLTALNQCSIPEGYRMDIYMVNDGCTDGTADAVAEKFPEIIIVEGNGNLFWNKGMHLAWTTAANRYSYNHFLWLNDDTILFPDTIDELIACSDSMNCQKIVIGTTCSITDKNKITYGGRTANGELVIPNGTAQPCDYFNGNIVLISKYIFYVVGINDPVFGHALGDFDYGKRAGKLGIGSVVLAGISGTCDAHDDFAAWCNRRTPLRKRLKLLYTPLGNHPIEFFRYDCRHQGFMIALFHFFTIHLRAVIPYLWKERDK